MNYNAITMEDILNLNFRCDDQGPQTTIRAMAKKVVQVVPYETESMEVEASMCVSGNLTGLERACLTQILHVSLEFSIFTTCLLRGHIEKTTFDTRKNQMVSSVLTLVNKLSKINPSSFILEQIVEQLSLNE